MHIGAVGVARAYGLDISLLRSCLQRSPETRLRLACGNASDIAHIRRRPGDFEGLLDRFVAGDVRFILVGSMAAAAHGSAYIPNDLDLCYEVGDDNLRRIAALMNAIDPRPREGDPTGRRSLDAAALQASPCLSLRTDEGDVDLLAAVEGIGDYDNCLAASEAVAWGSRAVRVLAPEALVIPLEARGEATETGPLLSLNALRELVHNAGERHPVFVHRF